MAERAVIEQIERQMEVQASQEVVIRLGAMAITALLYMNGLGLFMAMMAKDVTSRLSMILFLAGLSCAMLTLATSYVLAQISLSRPNFLQSTSFDAFILWMVCPPLASFVLFVGACLMWGTM
jgi:hypothetical protein